MSSKTPRTAVGEFVNASFTQTTKKKHIQSRLQANDDVPRSPSWIPTPRSKMAASRRGKSPGRAIDLGRQDSPLRHTPQMSTNRHKGSTPNLPQKSPRKTLTPRTEGAIKSPVDEYRKIISSIAKHPRHPVQHDRLSSLKPISKAALSLPPEEITPGTMVAAFLDGKDSTIPFVRQRARTSQTGVATSVPAQINEGRRSVGIGRRRSIGDSEKETPRALIQNFLENANSVQTPAISHHQRIQANQFVSPDLVVPSQTSFYTPSPFRSSASDKSQGTNTRLSVQRNGRRTQRPHVPFHVDASGSRSSLAESPVNSEPLTNTVNTPSPFKSSMSEDHSPIKQRSFNKSRRFSPRKPQKSFVLLDIQEDMPDNHDIVDETNQGEDSMDSTRAQASFDTRTVGDDSVQQYLENEENLEQEPVHYDADKENIDDHQSDEEYDNNANIEERGNIYNTDIQHNNVATPAGRHEQVHHQRANRSRELIMDRSPAQSNHSRERRSYYESPGRRSVDSPRSRSNRSAEVVEETNMSRQTIERSRNYINSPRLNRSTEFVDEANLDEQMVDRSRHVVEETNMNGQRSFRGSPSQRSSNLERSQRSRDFVEETDINGQSYHGSPSGRNSSVRRSQRSQNLVEETDINGQNYHTSPSRGSKSQVFSRTPSGNLVLTRRDNDLSLSRRRSYNNSPTTDRRSRESSHVRNERVGETEQMDEDQPDYDQDQQQAENGVDYDQNEVHEDRDQAYGVDKEEQYDASRQSGINQSRALPPNFVPEFTSTQQPSHDRNAAAINQDEVDGAQEADEDFMDVEENVPTQSNTQAKPKQPRKPRQKQRYSLPVSMVKKPFMRYADKRLSKDALEEVMKVSEVYWDNVFEDLKAYKDHAGRKTLHMDDFVLLFKRQGLINDRVSLNSLITKYMCMEDRNRLIPVARAGGRIELQK